MLRIIGYALVLPALALAGAWVGDAYLGLEPLWGAGLGVALGMIGIAILISIISTLMFFVRVLIFGGFLLLVVALGAYITTLIPFLGPIAGGLIGLVVGLIAMTQVMG